MLSRTDALAQRLAFAIPALLIAGAYVGEYGFRLPPCEMCWWQRYPHFVAIGLALLSTFTPPRRMWIALAALAIGVSGVIGVFHAGVEWDWWAGPDHCTGMAQSFEDMLAARVVRCDEAAWRFVGLSLAGWNALFSIGGAAAIALLLVAKDRVSRT